MIRISKLILFVFALASAQVHALPTIEETLSDPAKIGELKMSFSSFTKKFKTFLPSSRLIGAYAMLSTANMFTDPLHRIILGMHNLSSLPENLHGLDLTLACNINPQGRMNFIYKHQSNTSSNWSDYARRFEVLLDLCERSKDHLARYIIPKNTTIAYDIFHDHPYIKYYDPVPEGYKDLMPTTGLELYFDEDPDIDDKRGNIVIAVQLPKCICSIRMLHMLNRINKKPFGMYSDLNSWETKRSLEYSYDLPEDDFVRKYVISSLEKEGLLRSEILNMLKEIDMKVYMKELEYNSVDLCPSNLKLGCQFKLEDSIKDIDIDPFKDLLEILLARTSETDLFPLSRESSNGKLIALRFNNTTLSEALRKASSRYRNNRAYRRGLSTFSKNQYVEFVTFHFDNGSLPETFREASSRYEDSFSA